MDGTEQASRYNDVASAAAVAAASAAVTATAGIMKELSDIKVLQATNSNEIKNIGKEVTEIKSVVHEIQSLYVTHAELNGFKSDFNEKTIGLISKIDGLERSKVDKADFVAMVAEQEKRGVQIGRLYNYLWFSFGALAVLQIALTVFLKQ